jgi:cathepsin B
MNVQLSPTRLILCDWEGGELNRKNDNPDVTKINVKAISAASCFGNTILDAWRYLYIIGTPTLQCMPYDNKLGLLSDYQKIGEFTSVSNLPLCQAVSGPEGDMCVNFQENDITGTEEGTPARFYKTYHFYLVPGTKDGGGSEENIRANIYHWGPVSSGMRVYSNFYTFDATTQIYDWDGRGEQIGGHACCLPNTTILTENGFIGIENVKKNDNVMTSRGIRKVTNTLVRKVEEKIYELNTFLSLKPLCVTGNHPVMTSLYEDEKFSSCLWTEAQNINTEHYLVSRIDDTVIHTNMSFLHAEMFGYYLGFDSHKISIEKGDTFLDIIFNIGLDRYFVNIFMDIMNRLYDIDNFGFFLKMSNRGKKFIISSDTFVRMILTHCGRPKKKMISREILYMRRSYQLSLIHAWHTISGFGIWLESSTIHVFDEKLVESLLFMLRRNKINYRVDNVLRDKVMYIVHFGKHVETMTYKDKYVYSRITSVVSKNYTGMVHNLEVDKVNDYHAENIIVHNCEITGWGVENGVPYWQIKNTWGTQWGDQGYFKMIRGKNCCSIEENVVTGIPDFFYLQSYAVGFDPDQLSIFNKQRGELITKFDSTGGGIDNSTGYTRRAMTAFPWLDIRRPVSLNDLPDWKDFLSGRDATYKGRLKYKEFLREKNMDIVTSKNVSNVYAIIVLVCIITILILLIKKN